MRHRLGRLVLTSLLRRAGLIGLRIIVGCLIFLSCLAALSYMGLPVPGPAELLDKFKGITRLAEILS